MSARLHATCAGIEIGGASLGVLLTGRSGSGKSDLALRLIDEGARLVADDQVLLEAYGGQLFARAPDTIRGRLEVRGIGLVAVPSLEEVEVRLEIVLGEEVPRMPEPAWASHCGIDIPRIALDAFEASAPAKVRLALHALTFSPPPGVTFPFGRE